MIVPKAQRTPKTPKQKFVQYIILTAITFAAATAILITSQRTLEGLDVFEGQLEELRVTTTRRDVSKPATPIMVFTIQGLDAKLGIGQNAPADYSVYTDNLKAGDKIKVYYDKHGYLTPEGYNPYVFQLEKDGTALLDLEKTDKQNQLIAFAAFGLAGLALLGTILYYRKNISVIQT